MFSLSNSILFHFVSLQIFLRCFRVPCLASYFFQYCSLFYKNKNPQLSNIYYPNVDLVCMVDLAHIVDLACVVDLACIVH